MAQVNLLDLYPRAKRSIEERARLITEEHRKIARRFSKEYFDGERLYGYGGYHYSAHFWKPTVRRIYDYYGLSDSASILDVGCAKGFMLHDFKELMPALKIAGIDISEYAIKQSLQIVKPFLAVANAKSLPFKDKSFDLVISINTIHNLPRQDCIQALREISRVTRKHAFITVDAWNNDQEKERLLKWNLTASTYMHVADWQSLFKEAGYQGDYFWFIA